MGILNCSQGNNGSCLKAQPSHEELLLSLYTDSKKSLHLSQRDFDLKRSTHRIESPLEEFPYDISEIILLNREPIYHEPQSTQSLTSTSSVPELPSSGSVTQFNASDTNHSNIYLTTVIEQESHGEQDSFVSPKSSHF